MRGPARRPHFSLAIISVTVQLWTQVFWVISVYFNIRNTTPPRSLAHSSWDTLYIYIYIYIYIYTHTYKLAMETKCNSTLVWHYRQSLTGTSDVKTPVFRSQCHSGRNFAHVETTALHHKHLVWYNFCTKLIWYTKMYRQCDSAELRYYIYKINGTRIYRTSCRYLQGNTEEL